MCVCMNTSISRAQTYTHKYTYAQLKANGKVHYVRSAHTHTHTHTHSLKRMAGHTTWGPLRRRPADLSSASLSLSFAFAMSGTPAAPLSRPRHHLASAPASSSAPKAVRGEHIETSGRGCANLHSHQTDVTKPHQDNVVTNSLARSTNSSAQCQSQSYAQPTLSHSAAPATAHAHRGLPVSPAATPTPVAQQVAHCNSANTQTPVPPPSVRQDGAGTAASNNNTTTNNNNTTNNSGEPSATPALRSTATNSAVATSSAVMAQAATPLVSAALRTPQIGTRVLQTPGAVMTGGARAKGRCYFV